MAGLVPAIFVVISSTIPAKIVVHFAASPQSNPNISRFAPTAVVFWADSNCDLRVPVCGALLDNNKKTEAEKAPALRQ
jgi:hypothetical protein